MPMLTLLLFFFTHPYNKVVHLRILLLQVFIQHMPALHKSLCKLRVFLCNTFVHSFSMRLNVCCKGMLVLAGSPAICAYPMEIGMDTAIMIIPARISFGKFFLSYPCNVCNNRIFILLPCFLKSLITSQPLSSSLSFHFPLLP